MEESDKKRAVLGKSADRASSLFRRSGRARGLARLYQQLDKTQEWVENNYYHLPIEQQVADLIKPNEFWQQYSKHPSGKPFVSSRFAEASNSFSEMLMALAVLDLPFQPSEHEVKFDGASMSLKAASRMIVLHKEILPVDAGDPANASSILISQNFFRLDDRYRYEKNQKLDKYVRDEFLVHATYGGHIVVTNATGAPRKLDLLIQLPVGAIALANGKMTRTVSLTLAPYRTQTLEYQFYFPSTGSFPQFPAHVSDEGQLVASATPMQFKVVTKLSRVDRGSWAFVSQNGSDEEVLRYLRDNNVQRVALEKIAFRMAQRPFFESAIQLLSQRHAFNQTLWSYSLKHNHQSSLSEYLQHANGFVQQCGRYLTSPLLTIDPVRRHTYQHMEYRPLVNPRVHQLGPKRTILNQRFAGQYERLMTLLRYKRTLTDPDLLSVTYYLLLQDRVEESLAHFSRINPESLETRMQYDYCAAYLAFYREQPAEAARIADKYRALSDGRWRDAFATVRQQASEIQDAAEVEVVDQDDREQKQLQLAAATPTLDLRVEEGRVRLDYANVTDVRVNYYLMDIEMLFSRNPFVRQYTGGFAYVQPGSFEKLALDAKQASRVIEVPAALRNKNVLIEVVGGGQRKRTIHLANSMSLQMVSNYGQLQLRTAGTEKAGRTPIAKAYVKVYAQMRDGKVRFFKDGYTDLRGRFDYASLSTNMLDQVQKLSVLVMSDKNGAVVQEVLPPKR